MKIDDKCTRALLEAIEEATTYYDSFCYTPDGDAPKQLLKFSHDQIVYHIRYCNESGYLEGCCILGNGGMITVDDLSKAGHDYLIEARSKGLLPTIKSAWETNKSDGLWALICAIAKEIANLVRHFPC